LYTDYELNELLAIQSHLTIHINEMITFVCRNSHLESC